jgi:hypothetical protein
MSDKHARTISIGLFLNAALIGAAVLLLLGRDSSIALQPTANAQSVGFAGGGGLYLMPAQFGDRAFGCYIMDTDAQTLAAYQYADRKIKLLAVRSFTSDRQLKDYNTEPPPAEIRSLVEIEREKALFENLGTTRPVVPTN